MYEIAIALAYKVLDAITELVFTEIELPATAARWQGMFRSPTSVE